MNSSVVPFQDPPYRGGRCTLNMSRLKHPPVVVVSKLGGGVPAQELSLSLDRGSKLRKCWMSRYVEEVSEGLFVTLSSNTRANDDGARNFKPQSGNEDGITLSKIPHHGRT
ncbi:hypothetical protein TNCV_3530511 [Trichonephila clavipes]|nr:hypothetical protein TNCV_3530511 [Trichonephila clavipes]